jgi:hypothetical protein
VAVPADALVGVVVGTLVDALPLVLELALPP